MKSVTINGHKHIFLKLNWIDIVGASTLEGDVDFQRMKCANITTEAYLYDTFELDGREFVRTFASYSLEDDFGYGDRNCYPIEVFDKRSQKAIRDALRLMK